MIDIEETTEIGVRSVEDDRNVKLDARNQFMQ